MTDNTRKQLTTSSNNSATNRYRRLNDTALLSALRNEEPAAFIEFIERYQPMLSAYAGRFKVPESERDDWISELLHDVLIVLMKSQTEVPTSVAAYLIRACRNKAYSMHRASTRRAIREGGSQAWNSGTAEIGEVDGGLSAPLLRFAAAIEKLLTPEERQLLDWFQECVPLRTMGEWLGVTRAAAAQRVWRLRGRLRKQGRNLLLSFSEADQLEIRRFLTKVAAISNQDTSGTNTELLSLEHQHATQGDGEDNHGEG